MVLSQNDCESKLVADLRLVKEVSSRYYPGMDATRLHTLIERLGTLLRSDLRAAATAHGLALPQLSALHYLAQSNRYSDSPAAVADFLGATRGTVSTTLKALVDKGLVTKTTDARDGRVVHCSLTDEGRTIVEATYPSPLLANDQLALDEAAHDHLTELLRALQVAGGHRSFGVCRTCMHHQTDGPACGLTGEALHPDEASLICREHSLAQGP